MRLARDSGLSAGPTSPCGWRVGGNLSEPWFPNLLNRYNDKCPSPQKRAAKIKGSDGRERGPHDIMNALHDCEGLFLEPLCLAT